MPEWQQRGWPDLAVGEHGVERVQMHLLLLLHMAEHVGLTAASQDRELAGVDACRAIFAGMVDPDHAMDRGVSWEVAGKRHGPGKVGHAGLAQWLCG